MKNEIINNMTDKEKIMLFDLAINASNEKNVSIEKAMDSVLQAFLIIKNNEMDMSPRQSFTSQDPFEMNMAPSPEFIEQKPFEMDMSPNPNFVKNDPFNLNMKPNPDDFKSSDTFGPTIEPINTQNRNYDNNVSF